ncbi:MAG: CHAT domain-containing protein [Polyangiales bacterium]
MGRADDRHFLLDFTRESQADVASVALDDGDTTYQLRGRGQGAPHLVTLRWSARLRERLEALRAHAEADVTEEAARLGRTLADFVDSPAWTRVSDAVADAASRDAWLTVRSNAAELYLLPWELAAGGGTAHVGSLARLLVRYEMPDTRSAPPEPGLSRTARGRVVFAWSAAGGKVAAKAHVAAIEKAAATLRPCFDDPAAPALFEVKNASCDAIRAALDRARAEGEPVAVLHLLCHGAEREGSFGLMLDGAEGGAGEHVHAGRLGMLLRPYAGLVRLVVVSACDGGNAGEAGQQLGSVAQQLHREGFRAVIASRLPLSWDGATAFAEALYDGTLARLAPLERAFLAARARLMGRASYDWASLQLYARESDGDATHVFQPRPYRGLAAYGPEHARFFFGREREIAEVVGDLDALAEKGLPRFLVVSGASGTGKSSMVLGGAVPLWQSRAPDGGFASMAVRPGERPADALAEVEARVELMRAVSRRFVVVVDQFEEVFTHDDRAGAEALVRGLWRAACEPGSPVCVLVTMRVDFLARCEELVLDDAGLRLDKVACDPAHQVLVAQMSPEQLRDAVERPALAAGLALEPGLADDVVRDVEAAPGALPLMSHALYLLWRRRAGDVLTRADYRALGAVQGALDAHAEQVWAALGDEAARAVTRRLMLALVHPGGPGAPDTRRRRGVGELRARFGADRARFDAALARMVDARLLVTGGGDAAQTVEVAHEALIRSWRRFRQWIDDDRARLVQLAQLDAWAAEWRARPDALLRGSRLAVAEEADRAHGDDLGDDARALLAASRAERARELAEAERARRVRRAVAATAFAALSVVAAGGVALWRRAEAARADAQKAAREALAAQREAQTNEARSRASELRVRAQSADQGLETLADALAFRANVRTRLGAPPSEVDGALLQAAVGAVLRTPVEDMAAASSADDYAFSPDGSRVAAAGTSSADVRLWDGATGGLVAVLRGVGVGNVEPASLRFSRDNTRVLARFHNQTSMAWGARDGTPAFELGDGAPVLFEGMPFTVHDTGASSSDGAFTRFDEQLFRVSDGRLAATLPASGADLLDVREVPRDASLVTVWRDGRVRRWSLARAAFEGDSVDLARRGDLADAAFSPDGSRVVARGHGGATTLWDAAAGRAIAALDGATDRLPRFSPDGRYLLGGLADSPATRVWDAATGARVADADGAVHDLTENGERLLRVRDGGHVVDASDATGRGAVTGRVADGQVLAAAFAPRGMTLLVRSQGEVLQVRGEGDGALVLTLGARRRAIDAAALARGAVVTGGALAVWDARDGAQRRALPGDHAAAAFAVTPDGSRIAALHDDRAGRLWDVGTGALLATIGCWSLGADRGGPSAAVRPVVDVSADGATLLTTECAGEGRDPYGDPGLRLTDVATGDRRRSFNGNGHGGVAAGWLSPDGARVIAAHGDFTARLWDAASGRAIADWPASDGELLAARFTAGGARVVTAHASGVVVTWDARTGARLGANRHGAAFSAALFSPDGARLCTASATAGDALWDPATGRRIAEIASTSGRSSRRAFSADHSRLAAGYDDGSVALWDAAEGHLLAVIPAHLGPISDLAFSPDGARLATASTDGTARLWSLDPAVMVRASCALLRRRRALWTTRDRLRAACGERP